MRGEVCCSREHERQNTAEDSQWASRHSEICLCATPIMVWCGLEYLRTSNSSWNHAQSLCKSVHPAQGATDKLSNSKPSMKKSWIRSIFLSLVGMLTVPAGCRLHPNILKKLFFTSSSSVILAVKAIFWTHGCFLSPAVHTFPSVMEWPRDCSKWWRSYWRRIWEYWIWWI